jgi:hypothetical protein
MQEGLMKFNWEVSHIQNMNAWEEHRSISPRTKYDSLNEEEKAWLREFNATLLQLEDKYFPIMNAKHKELQARVADPSDWVMEFNLDYVITFYLREDDPEYEADDDHILMRITNGVSAHGHGFNRDWGFGATHVNHAEPCKYSHDQSHCYLYHQLVDHCHLDWRDIFRIGDLYFEIKIDEQSGMLPVNPFP